jgi:hypothetical protein
MENVIPTEVTDMQQQAKEEEVIEKQREVEVKTGFPLRPQRRRLDS